MSFSAGSITSALGLDVSPFGQGMLEAQTIMGMFPDLVTSFLANPLLGVVNLLAEVGGAMVNAFSAATDNADKLNDMATATGVNVEQLSALGLVAGQAGSGLESMGDAFKFLGKNAAEAADGNKEAVQAFADLGISQDQVKAGMTDLPGLMLKISDAMVNMSGPERTATAMKLLGRSGTELIPTLSQGSAAIREQMSQFEAYGATVSGEAAASADAWGDALGEIRIAWSGLQNVFAEPIRDTILPMLEEFLEWIRTHSEEIKEIIRTLANVVSALIKALMVMLQPLVSLIGSIVGMIERVAGGAISSATSSVQPSDPGRLNQQDAVGKSQATISIGEIRVDGIDSGQASSEVAEKISPVVRQAIESSTSHWKTAAALSDLGRAL